MVQEAISKISETFDSLNKIEAGSGLSKPVLLNSYRIISSYRAQLCINLNDLIFNDLNDEALFYREHWLPLEAKYQFYKWYCRHLINPIGNHLSNDYAKENIEKRINKFYNKHIDLIIYWESERSDLDEAYFLYTSNEKNIIAKSIGFQMLSSYLNQGPQAFFPSPFAGASLSHRQITQLVYAFHEDKVFDGATLKEVKAKFESAFDVTLGSFHKYWSNYKKDGAPSNVLDHLSDRLINRANREVREKQIKSQDFI